MIPAMIRMPAAPLVMMLLMVTLPRPASAQSARPIEVSGGYSFVRDPNNHISLAAGWMAGGGVALTDWLAAVLDAGGDQKTTSSLRPEAAVRGPPGMGGGRASAPVGDAT